MARIDESVAINAGRDRVWEIISDLDDEPRFWKGTKNVRNISNDNGRIVREITIAFRDQKCIQEVTIHPTTRIHAVFVKGIIQGAKTLTLDGTGPVTLHVTWDVELGGMMKPFTGIIRGHIEGGTRKALQSIKKEAEG